MSKYIKLEDAEKLLTNALRVAQGFDEPLEKSLVDLPTIEVSEDCISREQFREQMYHRCFEVDNDPNIQKWDSGNWLRWKLFEEELEKAPSVVPSRAEGEWIYTSDQSGYIGNPIEKCSVCGVEYEQAPFNYCPNCGAKMKGADNYE